MKKISIVLPNLAGGGVEKIHVNLANKWIEEGFKVEFVLMNDSGELKNLLSSEIKITNLNVKNLRNILIPLIKYFRKNLPNIILIAMWPLTSYAIISWLLSGRHGKIFVSEHVPLSTSAIEEIYVSKLYLKLFVKFTYPFANGIIAVSNGVKEDLMKIGNFKNKKIKLIYNPIYKNINSDNFKKSNINLWGGDFKYKLLSVGNLKKAKDHQTLIKAISYLPKNLDIKLVILGKGEKRKELLDLINNLDLSNKINLLGFKLDPNPWFKSANLFILSSLWEGFGNVLVESMQFGVPVISTNCLCGPAEILDNGKYGTLVPISDPQSLAEAIKENLLKTHDKNILIKRAQDFSIDKISKNYIDYMF